MSEVEAPAAAPAVAPEAPPKPVSPKVDSRRAMQDRLRKQDQAAAQPREAGKFAPKAEPATESAPTPEAPAVIAEEQPAVIAEPVTKSEPVAAEAATEPPKAAPGTVKIPLDERNPLWDQGVKELEVPAEMERHFRTLANAAVRSKEMDAVMQQLQAIQTENLRLNARNEALLTGKPPVDPVMQKMIAEIQEVYPDQFENVQKAFDALEGQRLQQADQKAMAQAQLHKDSYEFLSKLQVAAPEAFPAWGENLAQRLQPMLKEYGDRIDTINDMNRNAGRPPIKPNLEEFMSEVRGRYLQDPAAVQVAQRKQQETQSQLRQQIALEERQKLAAEEAAKLKETGERHATRPPVTPNRSFGTAAPPAEGEPVKHGTRHKQLKERIRQRYQQE